MKLLKELHKESKTRADWQVKWVQSYCRLSHCRSRAQSPTERILTVLKTISLLGNEAAQSPDVLGYTCMLYLRCLQNCSLLQELNQGGNFSAEDAREWCHFLGTRAKDQKQEIKCVSGVL